MYYLIKETLEKCNKENIRNSEYQYVAVLSREEWLEENEYFDMVIDLDTEPDQQELYSTKAEANYDSLTGTFCIPERDNFPAPDLHFSFALDEKGIVFIDDDNIAITYFGTHRTYKEFFKEINNTAAAFKSQGIREKDVVTILSANVPAKSR